MPPVVLLMILGGAVLAAMYGNFYLLGGIVISVVGVLALIFVFLISVKLVVGFFKPTRDVAARRWN